MSSLPVISLSSRNLSHSPLLLYELALALVKDTVVSYFRVRIYIPR